MGGLVFGVLFAAVALWVFVNIGWTVWTTLPRKWVPSADVFADSAPGVIPSDPEQAPRRAATRSDVAAPVAVRFEPPQGLRPEHLGLIERAAVGKRDLPAAIVDLAVAGVVRLTREEPDRSSALARFVRPRSRWRVTVTDGPGVPASAEPAARAELLAAFTAAAREADGRPLYLDDMAGEFRTRVPRARAELVGEPVVREWYPRFRRGGPFAGARRRSALGSALAAQSAGFRLYLATAEANQLRHEEGAGVFSRYLPWAVAYGLTERWVGLFKEAVRGLDDPAIALAWSHDLAWTGLHVDLAATDLAGAADGAFASLGDALEGFTDAVSDIADQVGELADSLGSDVGGGDGGGDGGGGGD